MVMIHINDIKIREKKNCYDSGVVPLVWSNL